MWTTLGEIGSWQSGATPSRMNKDYYGGNIPWLKTGDLNDGTIIYIPEYITQRALEETSVRLNPKGSVLIAMYGATIGKIGILSFPATTNQACCACYEYSINQMFLFYFLLANRENFIAMGGGGAQPNISKEKIISTNMPLPPLKEQERIVAEIERWLSFVDIVEKEKSDLQSTICLAKFKILDLAIHGKLVPQDPNDEPASELLKRINPKAEITCDNPQYGKLPKGWCLCKISSVVDIVNGKSQKNVESPTGKYPIYGSGGIIGKAMEYTCLAGSTIIGRKGTINHPIFVEKNFWNVDTAFGMKANNQILEDKYFYCFCLYFDFSKLDKSSALPSLTKTAIGNLILPIPPLAEQQRIVAKIEELFAQLDKIESSLQA